MAGSNWFSDLLNPVSDLLESIPIVGDVIKYADKLALNTDPSQLSTAAFGKLIGGDTEEYFTSEKARKGASHSIGLAALSAAGVLGNLLGGGGGGGAAATTTEAGGVSAGMGGAGEAASGLTAGMGGAGEAAGGGIAAGAGAVGEYGALTAAELAALSAEEASMAGVGITGGEGAGIFSSGAAPYASSAGTVSKSTLSNLMSNKLLMQYLMNAGKSLMRYGGDTSKGLQFTEMNATTANSIRNKSQMKLLSEMLGPDKTNAPSTSTDEEGSKLKKLVMYNSLLKGGL